MNQRGEWGQNLPPRLVVVDGKKIIGRNEKDRIGKGCPGMQKERKNWLTYHEGPNYEIFRKDVKIKITL